jgi:hypothetical protein
VLYGHVMEVLRRALYFQALIAALSGVALIAIPRVILVTLFGQPQYPDYAWVRLFGIASVGLALLSVLVAQKVEDLWFWSWAFVIEVVGQAVIVTLHAAFGLPRGAAAWPWWALAALLWLIAAALLWGIGRAGTEAPPP